MFFMTALHQLAAARGDGLRPDLLERIAGAQAPVSASNVVALTGHRCEGLVQAGPNPAGASPVTLPDNVLVFDARRTKARA